jgi:hypothetical protein
LKLITAKLAKLLELLRCFDALDDHLEPKAVSE